MPASSRAQRQAIEAPLGPVLVIAGPGAGKTFCLIGRIEHLLRRCGFSPQQICAVTFTNKAAEEIAVRLRAVPDQHAEAVTRGTLHWLCVGILRDYTDAVGVKPGFGIADEEYQEALLRRLGVWRKRRGALLTLFGRRRLQGYPLAARDEEVYRRYIAALRQQNMVDFDDLISLTAELFRRRADAAQAVASRWRYLLVDEGQDLDPTQYLILKHLAAPHRNMFVVGDDEQSIFSWRGAQPAVLREFQGDFGIAEPIILDRNRRCSHQIFETARRLVAGNPGLFDKQLVAERQSEHEVRAYGFASEEDEAAWILADLLADRAATGRPLGQYAVLYRKHWMGEDLEHAFLRAGLSCRLAQRRAVGEDPVIGHVVACLRVMLDPGNSDAQEALAGRLLPETLLEQLQAERGGRATGSGPFLETVRAHALTSPRSEPDTKRTWRYVYQVENLAGLRRAHTTLEGAVRELLAQRVGKYRNVLEEHFEELTDPAKHEAAGKLAERLRGGRVAGGRIWLAPAGGVEIALKAMLVAAGYSGVGYLGAEADPQLADVIVGPADAASGSGGLTLALFKALQLLHARDFQPGFRDYVAFDLETTDLDAGICDIVELAAVRARDGAPVAEFRTLLRGSRPVSARATAVHGYRDEDLAGAPTLQDVWPRFLEFVGRDVLVAHNGQRFDVPVLRRVGKGLPGLDRLVFFDTYLMARSLYRDSARLADLAIRFGVDAGRAHHALDDAVTLAHVFRELNRRKLARARTATLANLVDQVGLGLALEPEKARSGDGPVLFEVASSYALGRYSDCLENYTAERAKLADPGLPTLDQVIERLGGRKRMERLRAEPDPARRYPESMARLEALIKGSVGRPLEESARLLLERVALSTSEGPDVAADRVNLLTLHATKGLEFDCVYVVGVEDGQLPGARPGGEVMRTEIEEARRLLYVWMTRARDRLVLTRVQERRGRPGGGHRFLDEMSLEPVYVEPATAS
jgi:superfamily I DNA/RNA helicase